MGLREIIRSTHWDMRLQEPLRLGGYYNYVEEPDPIPLYFLSLWVFFVSMGLVVANIRPY